MANTKKSDTAVRRFLSAISSIRKGLEVQRERIQAAYDAAPRHFRGEPYEVIEMSGLHENDLDYYVYELGRLQDVAKAMQRPLGNPPQIPVALAAFEKAIPRLRDLRNPRTHFVDNNSLDSVVLLTAALAPDKKNPMIIEQLVNPLSSDHDAAMALVDVLDEVLHDMLRESMSGHQPKSLDLQIARRDAEGQPSVES